LEEYKIFKGNELEGKSGAQIQQSAQVIKQKFDQKRARYHQLRNQFPLMDEWDDLNERIVGFDNDVFNPWNQKWNQINRSNDINQVVAFFNEGNGLFGEMDKYISSISIPYGNSEDVESLKKEVLTHIETDILSLKTDVLVKVEEGINQLIGLNAEMGLEKNFRANLEKDLKKSNIHRYVFLIFFVLSVSLVPTFLASTFIMDAIKTLPYAEITTLRVGVTLSLAVLSYFFFTQYKLYQLISLRYSHLYGFLGGGATFINQLIGGDSASKEDVNKKMADLFMELEMVSGQVKNNQHPVEITIDKALEVVDKLSKVTDKFKG